MKAKEPLRVLKKPSLSDPGNVDSFLQGFSPNPTAPVVDIEEATNGLFFTMIETAKITLAHNEEINPTLFLLLNPKKETNWKYPVFPVDMDLKDENNKKRIFQDACSLLISKGHEVVCSVFIGEAWAAQITNEGSVSPPVSAIQNKTEILVVSGMRGDGTSRIFTRALGNDGKKRWMLDEDRFNFSSEWVQGGKGPLPLEKKPGGAVEPRGASSFRDNVLKVFWEQYWFVRALSTI